MILTIFFNIIFAHIFEGAATGNPIVAGIGAATVCNSVMNYQNRPNNMLNQGLQATGHMQNMVNAANTHQAYQQGSLTRTAAGGTGMINGAIGHAAGQMLSTQGQNLFSGTVGWSTMVMGAACSNGKSSKNNCWLKAMDPQVVDELRSQNPALFDYFETHGMPLDTFSLMMESFLAKCDNLKSFAFRNKLGSEYRVFVDSNNPYLFHI